MSACYNLLEKKNERKESITVLEIANMKERIVDISNGVIVITRKYF